MEKESLKKCPRCGYSPSGKGRSNPQNKYYWGCVVDILSNETGYTKTEIHDIIKYKFLSETHIYKSQKSQVEEIRITKSTTALDTKEFEELMSDIRVWASTRLGIFIPQPNEVI